MKRLFGLFMATAMMVGCSSDNETLSENGGRTETAYMSVKISAGDAFSARSTRGAADGGFVNGDATENAIDNIAFFFYDAKGNPFPVGERGNYYTAKPNDVEGTPGTESSVEKDIAAMIVLEKMVGAAPEKMVTVVNPTADVYNLSVKNLSEFQAAVGAFGMNGDKFIMTTSVFDNSAADAVKATEDETGISKITPANLKATSNEALGAPVKVYVERTMAKFSVEEGKSLSKDSQGNAITGESISTDDDGKPLSPAVEVVAKIVGWDVTGGLYAEATHENSKTYLMKKIDAKTWGTGEYQPTKGKEAQPFAWNDVTNKRSYWAASPALASSVVFAYDKKQDEIKTPVNGVAYAYENTTTDPLYASHHTKLIVKVKYYQKETTTEITPAEWMGTKYTEEGLKNAMANSVGILIKTKTTGSGGKITEKYEHIDKYIKIVKATRKGAEQYHSMAVFDYGQFNKDYSTKKDVTLEVKLDGKPHSIPAADVLALEDVPAYTGGAGDPIKPVMNSLALAKVWNGGGYYFLDVKHLGDNIGVVRNHHYQYTINQIKGLGTPICKDETKEIDPIKPDKDETYLSTKLHILSWKLVKHDGIVLE